MINNNVSEDSLEGGTDGGPNFADILNKALPDTDHSSCDSQSDLSSNSGEVSIIDTHSCRSEKFKDPDISCKDAVLAG